MEPKKNPKVEIIETESKKVVILGAGGWVGGYNRERLVKGYMQTFGYKINEV